MENFFSIHVTGALRRNKTARERGDARDRCIDGSWVVRKHDRSDRERVAIPKDFRPVLSRNTRFGELVGPAGTYPWM